METVYLTYASDGVTIAGCFANPQAFPTTAMASNDPAVVEFLNPPLNQTVLSQDIMAQFTDADATAIQTAITSNAQFWLLWSAFLAQGGPMTITNPRFLAGWSALIQVLGQPRMTAIATAVGVTIA